MQRDITAAQWFRKAAEQGNAMAQANLACVFESGKARAGYAEAGTTVSIYLNLSAVLAALLIHPMIFEVVGKDGRLCLSPAYRARLLELAYLNERRTSDQQTGIS